MAWGGEGGRGGGVEGQMVGVNGNANALWSLCAEINGDKWESVWSIKPAIVTTERQRDTQTER